AALVHLLLLLVAREQEVELGLERRPRPVLVEVGEERVVDVLEQLDPLEALAQLLHQGGLAYPDRAVDGQVVEGELDGGPAGRRLMLLSGRAGREDGERS